LLGREGFLAVAGISNSSGLITGVLTIFVAFIGYRMLMGRTIGLHDATGWVVRVGIVLGLLTGWSTFQTLVYDLAAAAPQELAQRLTASIDIPSANQVDQIQRVYDVLRLGTAIDPTAAVAPGQVDQIGSSAFKFQPPMPIAATTFLLATVGLIGAIKMVVAFLLAIAPIPIISILFESTYGLFIGWLRALLTAAFSGVAAIFISSLHLYAVNLEVERIQASIGTINAARLDAQAVVPIILAFVLLTLGLILAVARLSGGIARALSAEDVGRGPTRIEMPSVQESPPRQAISPVDHRAVEGAGERQGGSERIIAVSDALRNIMRREEASSANRPRPDGDPEERLAIAEIGRGDVGRRLLGRQHRSAVRRDRSL
jgi:type IV secretion system protein VirB6